MELLAKTFDAVSKEEMDGISLNLDAPFWELTGKTNFPTLLRALPLLLPERSILYFENGSPTAELRSFFDEHAVPEQSHVAFGTIWPRPKVIHVPATQQNLLDLANIAELYAEPELAIHFHVYNRGKILLQWHDAFSDPMLLSGKISENAVKEFAGALSMTYKKWKNSDEQVAGWRHGDLRP